MRETTEQSKGETAQPQRWWVDYTNSVVTGRLIDTMGSSAALHSGPSFVIVDVSQLKTSYIEACREAIERLAKVQADTAKKMAELLANMAKVAG